MVHPPEFPRQVLCQVARVQALLIDRPAEVRIVIIKGHPLVVPPELVGERCPQAAGADDGDAAGVQFGYHA